VDHKLCKDCKGYCCDDFAVTVSPEELENAYHKWKENGEGKKGLSLSRSLEGNGGVAVYQGIHLTYPMLIFTHKDNIHPDGDVACPDTIYHYRCKHHNQKTKMCDIHEIRPMVCRTHPSNGFCGYRKVRDKEVIAYRPKWFKLGLTQEEWSKRFHGDHDEHVAYHEECKENVKREDDDVFDQYIIDRLDNISGMLEKFEDQE
jgi:Fe-S-cluster containining protein